MTPDNTHRREWPALAPPPAPAPAAAPQPDTKTAEQRAFEAREIERSIRHGGRVML
jgi:hypothetical protein